MTVPYAFGSATTSIPLSELDANFNTPITIGNTAVQLGNTVTTLNNMTLANATVSSGNVTVTSASLSGNLTFTGTGNRITGDFSNATVANRVMFQTSTTNGNTILSLLPNGTSVTAAIDLYSSSSDPANSSILRFVQTNTDASIRANISGTGTYLPMTFYTGGSERMRIDTSGNVGIGTSSPTRLLTLSGSGLNTRVQINNTVSGKNFGLYAADDGSSLINYGSSAALLFTESGTERARIDSSGNLLVGTTSASIAGSGISGIAVDGRALTTSFGLGINSTSATGTQYFVNFGRNGSGCGSITSTTTNSTSYVTSSDYRLKENIKPMTGALNALSQLKPCSWSWKLDGSAGQGFIAHELQEVCPDAVVGEKDAVNADGNPQYQGVDTSFLVATLTAALQEAHGLIKDLQARVDALEAK